MKLKSIGSKLMISYMVLVIVTLVFLGVFFSYLLQDYLLQSKEDELLVQGKELASLFGDIVETGLTREQLELLQSLDRFLDARLWVVDKRGLVIAASRELPLLRGRRMIRIEELGPRFEQVLQGDIVKDADVHPLYNIPMLLVAVPFHRGEEVVGGVFLQAPITGIEKTMAEMRKLILWAGIFAIIMALVFSSYLTRVLGQPLRKINSIAKNMAGGDFHRRIDINSGDEIGELAASLNLLADNLEASLSALEKEKDTLNATISSIEEGVLAVDRTGRIFLSNDSAHRLLRKKPGSLQGAALTEVKIPPEIKDAFYAVMKGDKTKPVVVNISPQVSLLVYSSVIRSQGVPMGVVGLLHDISGLEKLEKMRRDFVANVSHELRRPLTAIKGFVEALLDNAVADEKERQRSLAIIKEESGVLEALIERLLDFSRLEKEAEDLERAPVNLHSIAIFAAEKMKTQAQLKDIEIQLEGPEDVPLIRGDIDGLEQATVNLLENAIKFSPRGGTIKLAVEECENDVVVKVIDRGPGIIDDEKEYIWQRFVKGEAARLIHSQGSGLGLSIVKMIIDAHGGQVQAKNSPTGGAEFAFFLPKLEN